MERNYRENSLLRLPSKTRWRQTIACRAAHPVLICDPGAGVGGSLFSAGADEAISFFRDAVLSSRDCTSERQNN